MMEANPHGFVFIAQVLVGIAATLIVYKALEQNVLLGWITAVGLTVVVVGVEWRLGEALFSGTYEEIQVLTAVAIVGAVVGVLTTVILLKPDLDRRTAQFDRTNNDQMEG